MKAAPLVVIVMLVSVVLAGPPKSRRREGPSDLSEEQHYAESGHEHNVQYDHEAFLGKEESEQFDQLSREEARRRLGLIVDKIDEDGDGSVSQKELEKWVRHVSRRYVLKEAEDRWAVYDKDGDGFIGFDEYKETMFGKDYDLSRIYDSRRQLTFKQAVERHDRRFEIADQNGDKKLDKEEFADFLHPAEASHMIHVYIDERMEEMDKDKNGKISLDEYIGGIWDGSDGSEEPNWVQTERDHFSKHRDRNKDGHLDKDEVSYMIKPPGYDPAFAEARHLVQEADTNKDKLLSKDEILDHQDLFVGSRATNYGDYMKHDEF